jgi:hypothetical protein
MAQLNEIAQDFGDTLSIFQADNREIGKNLPIQQTLEQLLAEPDNIEAAFMLLRTWAEENWVPLILEQGTEAQKAAIQTAFALAEPE